MEKARVLYVAQEMVPYLKDSPIGLMCRYLPQGIQDKGKEIRTFMPRYGIINERRNQLHEVIRLSGMNIIINDTDHPLIIKVASIQQARMQVYFIDNEDFFQRKFVNHDKTGKFFKDNDERAIFFARGVLETVKKLGWGPDLIHCHGWMSAIVPLYVKKAYRDNPMYESSKVILSVYDDSFNVKLSKDFGAKLKFAGVTDKDLKNYKKGTYAGLIHGALDFCDGVIQASDTIDPEVLEYIQQQKIPFLAKQPDDNYVDAYNEFYDQVLNIQTT